ncbi:MAG: hypothetical protein QOF41_1946 [Methylobacteriaceae bacterium]|nr:hypothetical protein [Methylobacteriaceae bacterium]
MGDVGDLLTEMHGGAGLGGGGFETVFEHGV